MSSQLTLNPFKRFKQKKNKKKKTTSSNASPKQSKLLWRFQSLGRALIFPIAVLPFAALLNRFGALGVQVAVDAGHIHMADWWIATIIQTPGLTVFNNLSLFFAIGVAFGLAKDNRGEAALVGALLYLILSAFTSEGQIGDLLYKNVLTFHNSKNGHDYSQLFYIPKLDPNTRQIIGEQYILNIGVFGGIVSGIFAAVFYNRLRNVELPSALSFFGGRRLVPMVAGIFSIPLAFMFIIIWPWCQYVLIQFGNGISSKNSWAIPGAFFYGVINRLAQPFGLHHILNTFLWFQLPINGDVVNFKGEILQKNVTINGDVNAFNHGVANAGVFQSGYFPLFLGGEPGIAFAMIYAVKNKQKRKEVAAFLSGVVGVAFLTGIDEPLVFSFIFVSPLLWGFYAFYTGVFNAIVTAMHIHLGFGFSAGLIDYIISFAQSWGDSIYYGNVNNSSILQTLANPLWILPIAVVMFCVTFTTWLYIIKKFNIPTPGRELEGQEMNLLGFEAPISQSNANNKPKASPKSKHTDRVEQGRQILKAIGGSSNIISLGNCATRLRFELKDNLTNVDDATIKSAGGIAILRSGRTGLQIIIGTHVESVLNGINKVRDKGSEIKVLTPIKKAPSKSPINKTRSKPQTTVKKNLNTIKKQNLKSKPTNKK